MILRHYKIHSLEQLAAGVVEALVDYKEGVAYLTIDKMVATPRALKTIASATHY